MLLVFKSCVFMALVINCSTKAGPLMMKKQTLCQKWIRRSFAPCKAPANSAYPIAFQQEQLPGII
jgi:hypothetical protein